MIDFSVFCGIVLCALVCIIVLKQNKIGISLPLSSVIGIGLMKTAFDILGSKNKAINTIFSNTLTNESLKIVAKIMLVSLLAEITADICRESGEGYLAKSIETIGKAEIIIICIPMLESIFSILQEIML